MAVIINCDNDVSFVFLSIERLKTFKAFCFYFQNFENRTEK
jgi:hypothetical protein